MFGTLAQSALNTYGIHCPGGGQCPYINIYIYIYIYVYIYIYRSIRHSSLLVYTQSLAWWIVLHRGKYFIHRLLDGGSPYLVLYSCTVFGDRPLQETTERPKVVVYANNISQTSSSDVKWGYYFDPTSDGNMTYYLDPESNDTHHINSEKKTRACIKKWGFCARMAPFPCGLKHVFLSRVW